MGREAAEPGPTLAVETCAGGCSVALADGFAPILHHSAAIGRGHAERLPEMAEAALAEAGWAWSALDLIVAAVGPGSFTGLRAGLAFARGWALALDRPALGPSALEAIAASRPDLAGPRLCAMDGRRGALHVQAFAGERPAGPVEARAIENAGQGLWIVADPALAARLTERDLTAELGALDARAALAAAHARWRAGEAPRPGYALEPIYNRAPDARPGAGRALTPALDATRR